MSRLEEIMLEYNTSIKVLSEAMGVSMQCLCSTVSRDKISLELALKIAKHLNCSLDYIYKVDYCKAM